MFGKDDKKGTTKLIVEIKGPAAKEFADILSRGAIELGKVFAEESDTHPTMVAAFEGSSKDYDILVKGLQRDTPPEANEAWLKRHFGDETAYSIIDGKLDVKISDEKEDKKKGMFRKEKNKPKDSDEDALRSMLGDIF